MTGCLGIIPARGGSKGLPGKNIADLGGRPMIAWTIDAALASGCIDRVVVSTDDPAIAEAAHQAGAEVPALRPAHLATDEASTLDVVRHAAEVFDNWYSATLVVLQPTSPFRTAADIRAALKLHRDGAFDATIAVAKVKTHPAWCFFRGDTGGLTHFLEPAPQVASARRQDRRTVYHPNGALYAVGRDQIKAGGSLFDGRLGGYIMPPERSLDIDTPWDLTLARFMIQSFP